MTSPCPFCAPDAGRVFYQGRLVYGLWDAFPVSEGHALLIPRRHVASWFEATEEERQELTGATEIARRAILASHPGVEAYNLGVNVGEAAGQTVPHLHLHVIPRRSGDVPDPRGGVRHVLPAKANLLVPPGEAQSGADRPATGAGEAAREAPPRPGYLACSPAPPPVRLLSIGGDRPLFPHLQQDLARAHRVDIAVAFVMRSGVERLREHLSDLLARSGELRLLTGDYLDVTDPDALRQLLDLQMRHPRAKVELRVFVSAGTSFHPKAYLVAGRDGDSVAYIGSSNLSRSALEDGIEWNYRVITTRDREGFDQAARAFEDLFQHPSTRAIDASWVEAYRQRRQTLPAGDRVAEEPLEPPAKPPEPNEFQEAALQALDETRAAGNTAGLVVLATGLGKTYLAAFDGDRPQFQRVLFVAHREEILAQAMTSFRRVRPRATFGYYDGEEKARDAEILFASIQTLGKQAHLDQFDRKAFDYIVVDEFHHAAAATYRRLIRYFEPRFLLGLTATPERSDGGDLLELCGENLVFRRDLGAGIEAGLLCAFQYFGVPDEVDYQNIPWRSTRFDEEALTRGVATVKRAENIYEQWQQRGGERTLAFCVSKRHADFMREYFRERGVRCAAVHSGPTSDARAESVEALGRDGVDGIQVLFAVDMFNEGVDVPAIDTVLMLRPTESQIVWLQQFGRGLRKHGDKKLTVVDYIGNHRTFLLKARTLLELPAGKDPELAAALERVQAGNWPLPPGCEVTYDLKAIEIMRGLLRLPKRDDAFRVYYEDFRERRGARPTAAEAFHDGYDPRSVRKAHGSWPEFVKAMGDLTSEQDAVLASSKEFLEALETTRMTKSFEMLVVLGMLNTNTLPGAIKIEVLTAEFRRLAERTMKLRADVGDALRSEADLRKLIERNPIDEWVGDRRTGGVPMFEYADGLLQYRRDLPLEQREAFQELVRELAEWRLAEYQAREEIYTAGTNGFIAMVSHASGKPILSLPDRAKTSGVPEGWTQVVVDGHPYQANFVKAALNVVRKPDGEENELPSILRGWFGPDAGLPGTHHAVACEAVADYFQMRPAREEQPRKLELWKTYSREQIPPLFGDTFSDAIWNVGVVFRPKNIILLVTLEKAGMVEDFKYRDRFLSPELFQWQSQNRTRQTDKHGRAIRNHIAEGTAVHLFVRKTKKTKSTAAPFVYCGLVRFESWEGEKPITLRWRLGTSLPPQLLKEISPSTRAAADRYSNAF